MICIRSSLKSSNRNKTKTLFLYLLTIKTAISRSLLARRSLKRNMTFLISIRFKSRKNSYAFIRLEKRRRGADTNVPTTFKCYFIKSFTPKLVSISVRFANFKQLAITSWRSTTNVTKVITKSQFISVKSSISAFLRSTALNVQRCCQQGELYKTISYPTMKIYKNLFAKSKVVGANSTWNNT